MPTLERKNSAKSISLCEIQEKLSPPVLRMPPGKANSSGNKRQIPPAIRRVLFSKAADVQSATLPQGAASMPVFPPETVAIRGVRTVCAARKAVDARG
jgi:hypothetical protein